jgi:hypothetical protein
LRDRKPRLQRKNERREIHPQANSTPAQDDRPSWQRAQRHNCKGGAGDQGQDCNERLAERRASGASAGLSRTGDHFCHEDLSREEIRAPRVNPPSGSGRRTILKWPRCLVMGEGIVMELRYFRGGPPAPPGISSMGLKGTGVPVILSLAPVITLVSTMLKSLPWPLIKP